jgi:protein-L-isoaspartate(D-aspartate) O-methyltransferase
MKATSVTCIRLSIVLVPILLILKYYYTAPKSPPHPPTMAWRSSGLTNTELITNLFNAKLITSPTVKNAMLAVDRAHYASYAPYDDSPQSIGYGATISAPHMHASACESLLPFLPEGRGVKVLDIGSGSGYLTHVLANIVCGCDGKGEGQVVGVDHIQELIDLSKGNMRKSEQGRRLLESKRVEFVKADGRKGYKEMAPYDAIHVGAAARDLHAEIVEQLKSPGRMFIPVEDGVGGGQWIWVVDKDSEGVVKRTRDMGVRYVSLTDAPKS